MNFKQITKSNYKVHDFISWQRSGSLVLSPSFQRRGVWSKKAKSFLIDSIISGLPIPIIFLREQTNLKTLEPIREVIDGQQRLRTLISFIAPNLIENFKESEDAFTILKSHNDNYGGKSYNELPNGIKERILNYEFSVHMLPPDTEDSEVLQIFARMNSTGVKLNDQELRNAEFFGLFKSFAYNTAYEHLEKWRTWGVFSETEIARMNEVEETSDLIQTMIEGIKGRSQSNLNNLYDKYDEVFPYANILSYRFNVVMQKIADTVGKELPDLEFSKKTLFNTLFVYYYDQLFKLNSKLDKKKPEDIPKNITSRIKEASRRLQSDEIGPELKKLLRGATGNLSSRKARLDFLKQIKLK